jgi:hypothetical protein
MNLICSTTSASFQPSLSRFANYYTPITDAPARITGVYLSDDGTKILISCLTSNSPYYMYYSTYDTSTGVWSSPTTWSTTYSVDNAGLSGDGTYIVGLNSVTQCIYYARWTSTTGAPGTVYIVVNASSLSRSYSDISICEDGSRIATISSTTGKPYWSDWSSGSSNYSSTFTVTLEAGGTGIYYNSMTMAPDKQALFYFHQGNTNGLRMSVWNGSNYAVSSNVVTTISTTYRSIWNTSDYRYIFLGSTGGIYYYMNQGSNVYISKGQIGSDQSYQTNIWGSRMSNTTHTMMYATLPYTTQSIYATYAQNYYLDYNYS